MNRETLRENRVHGHPLYPVSIYPRVEQLNGQSILDCHWHDEMEFIVLHQGSAVFQLDMTYVEVRAGEALFVNSGEIHSGMLASQEPCIFSAVVFSADLLSSPDFDIIQEKYIDPLMKKSFMPRQHITGNSEWEKDILDALHRIICENEAKVPAYELSTKAHLLRIFALLSAQAPLGENSKSRPTGSHDKVERLKTALHYIHDHYAEPLKLKELAGQINMSEGHFCRFFKQMTQKSPVEYVNHYRVLKACKLLENTDKKIVEVAMDVGFDNLSYFITVFKHHKGCTPSKYRKPFEEQAYVLTEPV
ncbi:AraC family transcriptional regulator [Paenibacillus cellulositrophicus]|uniref:AraC family transcriptional regulator n=1 Tax=Paenibacillus cellulositrophicus TaxID=562959 RepID=UPI003D992C53